MNLQLERIELREIELALKWPFETSFGRTARRRILIGYSEAKAIQCFAQDHDVPVWCGGMLEAGIEGHRHRARGPARNLVIHSTRQSEGGRSCLPQQPNSSTSYSNSLRSGASETSSF
jgi:hypothetical protein